MTATGSRTRWGEAGRLLRAGSMEGFRGLVLEHGVDADAIIEAAGLGNGALASPEARISTRSYRCALNIAAEQTGLRHFGLLLSQRQTFEKLGAVGYLVRHAPNLSVSIERLNRHFHTHDTGTMSGLQVDDGTALWTHHLAGVGDEGAVQQTELAIGLACHFVRSALGETWAPDAIYFEHGAPDNLHPFRAVFRCPVHFGQSITALEFPAGDLKRRLRQSDPGLFAILDAYVAEAEKQLTDGYVAQVSLAIQESIEAGGTRIDDVAAHMGMKRHALQRKLKREGTSFQAVLDDVRFELAQRYLRETRTPIAEIAGILGYAESAVFTRAFTRRSGMTPRSWRQCVRDAAPPQSN